MLLLNKGTSPLGAWVLQDGLLVVEYVVEYVDLSDVLSIKRIY